MMPKLKTEEPAAPQSVTFELHYHPRPWSINMPLNIYLFHCIGKPIQESRWKIHTIQANRSKPRGMTPGSVSLLRRWITHSLETRLDRKVRPWPNSMITWDLEHGSESPVLPVESQGACRNVKRCGSWDVELGDGLCVACFDLRTGNARGGEE